MRVTVAGSGTVLAENARPASTMRERLRGLLGRPPPGPGQGIVLTPARQVHTLFMRHSIDVVFCDFSWRVLRVYRSLEPWRLTAWVRGARYAIELGSGTVGMDVTPGTQLSVSDSGELRWGPLQPGR
jgi:uncharacterized membrane protein (UPF0127 family)